MAQPVFFVDRSLGRVRLPNMLRDRGWHLITLAEHYGVPRDEEVTDVEWLNLAGQRGWSVLMKDTRIRYRSTERGALASAGVKAFCLTSGNLGASLMVDCFERHRDAIWSAARGEGPLLMALTALEIRRIEL